MKKSYIFLGLLISSSVYSEEVTPITASLINIPSGTPASFILGASASNIPVANNFNDFATEVSKGLKNGEDISAVSVQFNPFYKLDLLGSWNDLENSRIKQSLAQTTISAANTLDNIKATGLKNALGFQSIVYSDKYEKLNKAIITCMHEIEKVEKTQNLKFIEIIKNEMTPEEEKDAEKYNDEIHKARADRIKINYADYCGSISKIINRWNNTSVSIGYAHGFKANKSDMGDLPLSSDLDAYWITVQIGKDFKNIFKKKEGENEGVNQANTNEKKEGETNTNEKENKIEWLMSLHARHSDGLLMIEDEHRENINQKLYGVNFKIGTDQFRSILEYSYIDNDNVFSKKETYLFGIEFPVFKSQFLTLGVVGDSKNQDQGLVAKFHWKLNDEFTLPFKYKTNKDQ